MKKVMVSLVRCLVFITFFLQCSTKEEAIIKRESEIEEAVHYIVNAAQYEIKKSLGDLKKEKKKELKEFALANEFLNVVGARKCSDRVVSFLENQDFMTKEEGRKIFKRYSINYIDLLSIAYKNFSIINSLINRCSEIYEDQPNESKLKNGLEPFWILKNVLSDRESLQLPTLVKIIEMLNLGLLNLCKLSQNHEIQKLQDAELKELSVTATKREDQSSKKPNLDQEYELDYNIATVQSQTNLEILLHKVGKKNIAELIKSYFFLDLDLENNFAKEKENLESLILCGENNLSSKNKIYSLLVFIRQFILRKILEKINATDESGAFLKKFYTYLESDYQVDRYKNFEDEGGDEQEAESMEVKEILDEIVPHS